MNSGTLRRSWNRNSPSPCVSSNLRQRIVKFLVDSLLNCSTARRELQVELGPNPWTKPSPRSTVNSRGGRPRIRINERPLTNHGQQLLDDQNIDKIDASELADGPPELTVELGPNPWTKPRSKVEGVVQEFELMDDSLLIDGRQFLDEQNIDKIDILVIQKLSTINFRGVEGLLGTWSIRNSQSRAYLALGIDSLASQTTERHLCRTGEIIPDRESKQLNNSCWRPQPIQKIRIIQLAILTYLNYFTWCKTSI